MFWKGPVFTKDGFRNRTINLENCEVVEGVDGEEDGSATHTTNIGYKSGQDLTIGAWNSNYYNSNISNLRITKGVARWTADFDTDSIITSPGDFPTSTGNSSDDSLYYFSCNKLQ